MVRFSPSRYLESVALRLLHSRGAAPSSEGPPGGQVDPLRSLAALAGKGDRDAQRTLLVALGPRLLGVIRGVIGVAHPDVEDVLQQAMVAIHLALPSFRAECSVHHFATRIVVQTAMNARRRAGYRTRHTPNVSPDELAEMAYSNESPVESLAASRQRDTLRQLLDELPSAQAEVLALHTMLGHSVEETASIAGAPENTVRSRLRGALAALRARLQTDRALLDVIKGGS